MTIVGIWDHSWTPIGGLLCGPVSIHACLTAIYGYYGTQDQQLRGPKRGHLGPQTQIQLLAQIWPYRGVSGGSLEYHYLGPFWEGSIWGLFGVPDAILVFEATLGMRAKSTSLHSAIIPQNGPFRGPKGGHIGVTKCVIPWQMTALLPFLRSTFGEGSSSICLIMAQKEVPNPHLKRCLKATKTDPVSERFLGGLQLQERCFPLKRVPKGPEQARAPKPRSRPGDPETCPPDLEDEVDTEVRSRDTSADLYIYIYR